MSWESAQSAVTARFGVTPSAPGPDLKVGIAKNVGSGAQPLNALRHTADGGTSGWFIWAGEELSSEPDAFEPLHIAHLPDRCPEMLPYLALPPGWRVLIAPGIDDAWFDEDLVDRPE